MMTLLSLIRRRRGLTLTFVFVAAGQAQILQNNPELCGKSGQTIPLPEGTTFFWADGQRSDLTLKLKDGSTKTVDLVVASSVRQVCPIAGDRLLVFPGVGVGADGPWIISQTDGKVLDAVGSRQPVVSPDQHWLIYRQWQLRNVEIEAEFYLLYDLTRDAGGNRQRNEDPRFPRPPGRQVYPVTANHIPHGPDDSLKPAHEIQSESFYWSPDSRFVGFADASAGTESIVLVKVGEGDLTTYTHPLQASEICEGGALTRNLGAMLHNVEFLSDDPLPQVFAYFRDIPCRKPLRQPLQLRAEDFKPAAIEVHERIHPPKK